MLHMNMGAQHNPTSQQGQYVPNQMMQAQGAGGPARYSMPQVLAEQAQIGYAQSHPLGGGPQPPGVVKSAAGSVNAGGWGSVAPGQRIAGNSAAAAAAAAVAAAQQQAPRTGTPARFYTGGQANIPVNGLMTPTKNMMGGAGAGMYPGSGANGMGGGSVMPGTVDYNGSPVSKAGAGAGLGGAVVGASGMLIGPQINGRSVSPDGKQSLISEGAKSSQWTALDLGGMQIRNVSKELFRYTFLTVLYLNHNALTTLPAEISRLKCLVKLEVSGNHLVSLPPEIGLCTALKELLAFDNNLTTLPHEMGQLYQLESLGVDNNPLNEELQVLVKSGAAAVVTFLRDNSPVPAPPPPREWLPSEHTLSDEDERFTVFCYNVLCEKYATSQMYPYTPSGALSWDFRKELIMRELAHYNADIVCLQEVEMGHYEDYMREAMRGKDYESLFTVKTRALTMPHHERRLVDGCAVFFKSSRYQLLDSTTVQFGQLSSRIEVRTPDMLNRVSTKDNVAIVCLLQEKKTGTRILVANVHIHWDPEFKDVKLIQTGMLVDEVEKMINSNVAQQQQQHQINGGPAPSRPSVVICGDFNSIPSSGVYELLSRGSVPPNHSDFDIRDYGPTTRDGLRHSLGLRSAYVDLAELPFTNYTPSFSGTIDYIWHSTNSLLTTGVLGPVDSQYLGRTPGFPNAHFPSDHIPIMAQFKLVKSGGGGAGSGATNGLSKNGAASQRR